MTEFNLSEKIVENKGRFAIHPSFVKEFIKILKEELNEKYQDLCYDSGGFNLEELIDIINKLSGEKLNGKI